MAWAREPAGAQPVWWSQRLTVLRPFAAYLNACGADVPVIPRALLPAATTRATPFIYSQADLDALIGACPAVFTSARVAATVRVIIGLLAATGIRIGEAVRLMVPDFDAGNDVILVRGRKTPLDRLVPVDPTTTAALAGYLAMPERLATHPDPAGPVFVNYKGTGFAIETIEQYFKRLTRAAGLEPRGRARPRLHDLRHTFATSQKMSNVASSASFSGSREHALPAAQRAALRRSRRDGARSSVRDLGCQQPVAPGARMRHLIWLQQVTACCGQGNVQERSEDRSSVGPIGS